MSRKHPVIAVTGSSGAGTTTVKRAFENIFRREKISAAFVEGDSLHSLDRMAFRAAAAEAAKAGNHSFSHFGPEANHFEKIEEMFKQYGETGMCKRRYYVHSDAEAVEHNKHFGLTDLKPGVFTPWEDIEKDSDHPRSKPILPPRGIATSGPSGVDPGYALAFWGLGNLYEFRYVLHSQARDLIQMLDCYESAIRANPLLAEPYLGRGWARFYEQNFDLACSSFRQALRIHPDNPDVQLNAGSFLRSLGLFREALKFYSAAIDFELDPLNTTPHILMANCYSWQGEFEKAGEVMRRAHSLDPGNDNIPLGLARLALLKGDMVGETKRE